MQSAQSAATQQQEVKMRSQYERMLGKTVFGPRLPVILEWGTDDMIRIHTKPDGQADYSLERELHPQDIKKFGIYIGQNHLILHSGEKYYLLPPNSDQTRSLMAGTAAGSALGPAASVGINMAADKAAADIEAAGDSKWWADALRPYGVKIHEQGSQWLHKADVIIYKVAAVAIILIVLAGFVFWLSQL